MRHLEMFGIVAIVMVATMVFGVSAASATTLEVGGLLQATAVELRLSFAPGSSLKLQKTDGSFANTCTESSIIAKTTTFTGTAVSGPVSSMSFTRCTTESIVVDSAGNLSIEQTTGTTNGTVQSAGAEVTVPSPFGKLNCKTGAGTDLGTLTGKASGQATIDFKAVINCGILSPSAVWEGAFVVTSPEGLGVTG